MFGELPLIQGEKPEEFHNFAEKIWADLKPEGALEEYFADRVIKDAWWLDRFEIIIAALLVDSGVTSQSIYQRAL